MVFFFSQNSFGFIIYLLFGKFSFSPTQPSGPSWSSSHQTFRKPVDLWIYPTACLGAKMFISNLGTSGFKDVSAYGTISAAENGIAEVALLPGSIC
jgi:hypothetical protein